MKAALALALVLHGTAEEPATNHVDTGALGVALAAAGAALATGTATGAILLEALTTPDDPDGEIAHPELVQVTGFATIVLGSVSAILVLAGGALIVNGAR